MKQFLHFSIIGILNTILDIGVLSLCIFLFGLGWSIFAYPIFKLISFLAALFNSYILNKKWVFKHQSGTTIKELSAFVAVSLGGLFINIGISSAVFMVLSKIFSTTQYIILGNVAALCGTVFVLIWNFVGYKFLVFQSQKI